MIDRNEAEKLVAHRLNCDVGTDTPDAVILTEITIEKDFGWVFFYQSKKYIKTKDFRDKLIGNAPYIVNRYTSDIVETGTARDIDYYIEEYEKQLKLR